MMLVSTDESIYTLNMNEELWNKIRDHIRSVTNFLNNCDEKYTKIKFNSDDNLLLKNIITLWHDNNC